jgi:hypothetical protein
MDQCTFARSPEQRVAGNWKGTPLPRSLPDRPNLEHLRGQAKTLHRAAAAGDADALARIHAVSDRVALTFAQRAIAQEYGFSSWEQLKAEVERRTATR